MDGVGLGLVGEVELRRGHWIIVGEEYLDFNERVANFDEACDFDVAVKGVIVVFCIDERVLATPILIQS